MREDDRASWTKLVADYESADLSASSLRNEGSRSATCGQSTWPNSRTDGGRLIIEPIRGAKRAKVKADAERAMAAHDATLRKLAK